jgi:hypothetical protein
MPQRDERLQRELARRHGVQDRRLRHLEFGPDIGGIAVQQLAMGRGRRRGVAAGGMEAGDLAQGDGADPSAAAERRLVAGEGRGPVAGEESGVAVPHRHQTRQLGPLRRHVRRHLAGGGGVARHPVQGDQAAGPVPGDVRRRR